MEKWKGTLLLLLLPLISSPLDGFIHIRLAEAQTPEIAIKKQVLQNAIEEYDFLVDAWIKDLAFCESRNNQNSVNPKDSDGLPSFGKFQFRMGTFHLYMRRYFKEITDDWEQADWQNNLMSGDAQEMALREMIGDERVNLRREFPGCTRKLGLPPRR